MQQKEFLNQILSEGTSPPPLKDFISLTSVAQALQDRLDITDLIIETHKKHRKGADEVTESFGSKPVIIHCKSLSFEGSFYWIMNPSEMKTLCLWTLTKDYSAEWLHDHSFMQGYFTYLFLQAMSVLKTLSFFSNLQLQVVDTQAIEEDCHCIDMQFFSGHNQCQGRLAITETAYNALKKSISQFKDYSKSSSMIPLKVVAGTVSLTHEQKNEIQSGDFIILDSVHYDPKTHQGNVDLYFEKHPLFKVLLKQKKLKLLSFHSQKESNQEAPHEIFAELASLSIAAHKLYTLQPEDSLEITVDPSQRLSLVEKNKIFAHAELLHIGEVVGVRVLELVTSL